MQIETKIEHEISPEDHAGITILRNACFPDGQHDRSYFKQLPHFRILAYDSGNIVGQVGIDHRMMKFGSDPVSVFGIVDLCVAVEYRNQGIASRMIDTIKQAATKSGIDVIFLFADDKRLYRNNGFTGIDALCSWLRIDEHTNYGVAIEQITDEMMIFRLKPETALEGPIDFLGYLY